MCVYNKISISFVVLVEFLLVFIVLYEKSKLDHLSVILSPFLFFAFSFLIFLKEKKNFLAPKF